MKTLSKTVALTALAASVAGAALAEDRVVRIYNWSDYIAEDTLENFTAETGIDTVYDVYDSNDILEAKVLSGQSGYDLVMPTTDYMARQIQAGAYQKLDKSLIPNWGNLNADVMASLASYDPGNEYGVPWQLGTTGIGYNVDKIQEILGDDAPVGSWALVFEPEYASKLAECGITMLDSPDEVYANVLQYMGMDPNSENPDDYAAATEKLEAVRPYVQYFHSSRYITDLANGDVCISIGWSGDVFQAMARAEEAENDVTVDYYIPREGAPLWADMMVIPADSRNAEAAHAFINYMLQPQPAADLTNYVWYGSPVEAAKPYIDEEILNNPGIYPEEGTELFSFEVLSNSTQRLMTRSWTRLKSGS
ncbi:spermidine/putrescine ABC transporter substrate-binding protein PotF [Saccharospirillum sp. MSK14-1]|uniref:polyamine ABC transporter substrate-binding protein n=1 Tax=Saccharospirillum sp. MSK14-1 TaxID=1897632 RepID=UPI000D3B077D|nr:polyamine ABC transporter substrate-binding protein [Saccharospirillum sp. MSK14-1]PTY38385.1 spermidine/putrescine ABC transporter substrate-binding protein PotF [Saccharospirillum sp. MSK14-1]